MKQRLGLVVSLLVAGAGLGGCASTECAAGAGAKSGATTWQFRSDDTCLQGFEWKPFRQPSRGVVVVIHGIRDHATRYSALANALTARGFAVYSHDLRGHGHSGGHRQRFDSIEQLLADVDLVVRQARAHNPGRRVFVYGHSLGGLIAAHYGLAHQSELGGLVLSGPALKLFPSVTGGEIRAAKIFGAILPNLPAQAINDDDFVSAPQAKDEFMKDPLIDHAKLPARSAKTGLKGIEAIGPRLDELTLPMLIMHGGKDRATNADGSRELYRRAKVTDKALIIYENQFHDLLHEPHRNRVISDVVKWLEAHTEASVTSGN